MTKLQHIKRTFEGWEREHTEKNIHRFKYVKENEKEGYLTLSGSADTLELDVGFPFRLVRIELVFDDATARDIDMYFIPRGYGTLAYPPRLYHESGATFTDLILQFAEGYEKESAIIRFIVDGTANKLMYPVVYVQEL